MARRTCLQLLTALFLIVFPSALLVACRSESNAPSTIEPDSTATAASSPTPSGTPPPAAAIVEPVPPDQVVNESMGGTPAPNPGIVVADTTTGQVLKVRVPGAGRAAFEAGLPDGRMLIGAGGITYLLDMDAGGTLTALWRDESVESLFPSPSGKLIARMIHADKPSLVLYSVDEGRELARTGVAVGANWVSWASDEAHLAYMEPHPDPNHYAISLMSLDKPDEKVMLDEVLDAPFPAAWMADSRTVLFAVGGDLKRWDTETGERDLLFQWPGGNITNVSLSPDEHYALLTGYEWVGQGSVSTAIVAPVGQDQGVKVTAAYLASWSPAEDTMLVIANACTDSHELWLVGAGGELRLKVDTTTHPYYARWSADGSRIMYETAYVPREQRGTTIVEIKDGHESIVTRMAAVYQTTWWSPNGRWIVFRPHAAGICEMSQPQMTEILPFP